MRVWTLAALAFVACLAPMASAQQSPELQQGGIDGLWAARMRYGPDVRGPLLIARHGGRLMAEISGRSVRGD